MQRTCLTCVNGLKDGDPHSLCLIHTFCITEGILDPRNCTDCHTLFENARGGNTSAISIWNERVSQTSLHPEASEFVLAPTTFNSGNVNNANIVTLEAIQQIINGAVMPITERLNNLESEHNEFQRFMTEEEDEADCNSDVDMHEEVENTGEIFGEEPTPVVSQSSSVEPYYVLHKDACVRQQVIEYGDLSVAINGVNPALEVCFRNGRHVIRALRHTSQVDQLLESCELESDISKDVQATDISKIRAPLHTALQHEFGWEISLDKSIRVSQISQSLCKLANSIESNENLTKQSDAVKFSDESHTLIKFASAARLAENCHEMTGILAGLTTPVPRELRIKDFEQRQKLLMWLKMYESSLITSRLLESLSRLQISKTEQTNTILRETSKINGFVDAALRQPMLPGLTQALINAKTTRLEVRKYATQDVQPTAVQFTLRSGATFTDTLFVQVKIAYNVY